MQLTTSDLLARGTARLAPVLEWPSLDAGMLLAFSGGWHHDHAILRVMSGERLTMSAFYTLDPAHREAERDGIDPVQE